MFVGGTHLPSEPPIEQSNPARWRQRLGEEGLEELPATMVVADQHSGTLRQNSLNNITLTPNAVAHPTAPPHLLERSREYLVKAAGECISKGKARTPYSLTFNVKVSITIILKEGFVLVARSMPGNPYDSHTFSESLKQAMIKRRSAA